MEKVKRLLAAGATLSEAVKSALAPRSLSRVALERGVNLSELSSSLSGSRLVSDRIIGAMIAELGGTADDWRQMFSDAMQARAAAAVGQ